MSKLGAVSHARRRARRHPAQLPNAVEGQLAELCRDLEVQVKRMRQLQEQADELRTVIGQWAGRAETDSSGEPATRAGRR